MKATSKQGDRPKKSNNNSCQFIVKLLQMMKQHPNNVKWSEDGECICFINLDYIQNKVIPEYFRHRNLLSFVRQLNMYYFSKMESQDPNLMKFRHNIFKRGNQDNYHLINRRNKTRDQIINNLQKNYGETIKILQSQCNLPQQAKSLIRMGVQYLSISLKNMKKIKGAVEQITQQMKTVRNKQIKSSVLTLKNQSIPLLSRLIQEQKKLQSFAKDQLCRDLYYCKQPQIQQSFGSQILFGQQQRTYKQIQLPLAYNLNSHYSLLKFNSNCSLDINLNANRRQEISDKHSEISLQQDLCEEDFKDA